LSSSALNFDEILLAKAGVVLKSSSGELICICGYFLDECWFKLHIDRRDVPRLAIKCTHNCVFEFIFTPAHNKTHATAGLIRKEPGPLKMPFEKQ
jgi:hypothetical protein